MNNNTSASNSKNEKMSINKEGHLNDIHGSHSQTNR